MYKEFNNIESLYQWMEEDKDRSGAEANQRNRYPLRFILFENFRDFSSFVEECQSHNVFVDSIEKWLVEGCSDQMLTNSQLADYFKQYVKESGPNYDYMVAPFSEVTRFYDKDEFNALLKTIRLIEASEEAQQSHQRIYVPIVGMQGKMSKFKNDPNIHIWEYHVEGIINNYQLILTKGTTYGIQGLDAKYTICHDLKQWIALWETRTGIKQYIICTSTTIFQNAHHAQPDNAFEYVICNNVYEFLKKGLGLDFTSATIDETDLPYWEKLAKEIDIRTFSFENFINERFNTLSLDDEKNFILTWLKSKDDYSRWLLKTYFLNKGKTQTYLGRMLTRCKTQNPSDLFSLIATQIFEEKFDDTTINQRAVSMNEAFLHGIKITDKAEHILKEKLESIASDPSRGTYMAMKYMTPLTISERTLMITWLGQDKIKRDDIKSLFPNLYYYTSPFSLPVDKDSQWINDYFESYCKAKVANQITEEITKYIKEKNASQNTFMAWHDQFKTVKTILFNRKDIDVFYWIDGLGVDWIPFIIQIIKDQQINGIFLNEIYIATAELPTRTANNKIKLEELAAKQSKQLTKLGDIDNYAHNNQKEYPNYLIEEFNILENCIKDLLSRYSGQKIAIISDHGISYLSQLANGLNLAGINCDHSGRCGVWSQGKAPNDNKYLVLDDEKICSLTHDSLSSKTPTGNGAHGGATPEEVLVPVIIISGKEHCSDISAKLMSTDVTATSPVIQYKIKGISSIDIPIVKYNDVEYHLYKVDDDCTYQSERLNLVETAKIVTIIIGKFTQTDNISINTGVVEDDLFGDL